MNARSNGPASPGSAAPAANASRAGRFTTTIRSSGIPACRHQPRARAVRERSGSIVTIVPSAGWPSAMHSVEYPYAVPTSTIQRRPAASAARTRPASRSRIGMSSGPAAASISPSTGWRGAAADSIHARSPTPGTYPPRVVIAASSSSDQQAGAEIEARRQDRPRGDRPDIDVEETSGRFHGSGLDGLPRRPGHDEREDKANDQPEPDELRPRPAQRSERRQVLAAPEADPGREERD